MRVGRYVALVLALSLTGSLPLMSEQITLLNSLTLLDSTLSELQQKLDDSATISAELAARLNDSRTDLESLSISLSDSEKRAAELETTAAKLEVSLQVSAEQSSVLGQEISRWRLRARRRGRVIVGLAALVVGGGYLLVR